MLDVSSFIICDEVVEKNEDGYKGWYLMLKLSLRCPKKYSMDFMGSIYLYNRKTLTFLRVVGAGSI